MGKASNPYPTGRFRLYKTNRAKTNQPLVVQMEYSVKSVAVRRATGISVYEKDWNPKENNGRGGLRSSYGQDYRNVNSRLLKKVSEMDVKIAGWCETHPHQLTVDMLRALIDDSPVIRVDKGIDFAQFITDNLKSELDRNIIGQSVYKNGLSGMNIFGQFLQANKLGTYARNKIYVSEISTSLIEKYIKWRREFKHNTDETINHALTPILKGCQEAMQLGYISSALNAAIQKMRIAKSPSLQTDDKTKIKHLSKEQLTKLIEFYRNDTEQRRKEYLEMFLFALYACGLRLVDVLTLQWSDIDLNGKTLNKIQVKTRNRNIIPISGQAMRILDIWKGRHNRFVFGLLHDDFNLDDSNALYLRRTTVTASINQALTVAGRKIDLPFGLTFHVSRHTFAVQSLNNDMSLTMVSQLLGHSTSEMTEKVYAHFVPTKLRDELMKINLPDL